MTPIKRIILDRVEGRASELAEREVRSFKEADLILREWAKTAPADRSYHKVDVVVEWENGQSIAHRFDLQSPDIARINLAEDFKTRLKYNAGLYCPPGISQQAYFNAVYAMPEANKQAKRILKECQLS